MHPTAISWSQLLVLLPYLKLPGRPGSVGAGNHKH
jgi:hypothetical protein